MRIFARLLLLVIVLAVLLALLNLWAGRYLGDRIDQTLQQELPFSRGSEISYSALHLNPARAQLSFRDLQVSDSTMRASASIAHIGLSYADIFRMFMRNPARSLHHIERLHIQAGSLEFIMPETIAGQLYIERMQARGSIDFSTVHPHDGSDAASAQIPASALFSGVHSIILDLQMEALLWTPPAALADTYGLLFTLFELPETELPVRRITVPLHMQDDTLRVVGATLSSVAFDAEWEAKLVPGSGDYGWEPVTAAVTLVRLSDETEQFVLALEQFFQISFPKKNGYLHLEIKEGTSNLSAIPGTIIPPF